METLDSHRSLNPAVNCTCEGSRLCALYENLFQRIFAQICFSVVTDGQLLKFLIHFPLKSAYFPTTVSMCHWWELRIFLISYRSLQSCCTFAFFFYFRILCQIFPIFFFAENILNYFTDALSLTKCMCSIASPLSSHR